MAAMAGNGFKDCIELTSHMGEDAFISICLLKYGSKPCGLKNYTPENIHKKLLIAMSGPKKCQAFSEAIGYHPFKNVSAWKECAVLSGILH
eukprot:gnl/MRDRNA2_/MRDRNA2_86480_c0_seq14.p3 gnl/MRDRNA2_/MRDRNA2_86480_c0~~gnl/MRDRNA2_/MRDRNA2_86480_c0_seq14.p3  ORF type:complete len:106 (+),score=12.30 gnl/MRDRNA2_/MRDRNA2_86480_c0_seq14:47-319(+)